MKKVSGGKTKNTKYLSEVLGGLVAINGVVALPASASTEREEKSNLKVFSIKLDKSDAKKIGGGSTIGVLGTALVWMIKEFATKKSKQQMCDRAELYEMFHPDLAEHLPAKTIPYLRAVGLYLSYKAACLDNKLGEKTKKDLTDEPLTYLAENVIFEAALLAGKDVGLNLSPKMVQRAIALGEPIKMDKTTIKILPHWRENRNDLLYLENLLSNISLTLPENQMIDIYYRPVRWLENAKDCKEKYHDALFKATRIMEDKYSSFNDTSNEKCYSEIYQTADF